MTFKLKVSFYIQRCEQNYFKNDHLQDNTLHYHNNHITVQRDKFIIKTVGNINRILGQHSIILSMESKLV